MALPWRGAFGAMLEGPQGITPAGKDFLLCVEPKIRFLIYGSWGPLGSLKILPQGAPTFSTPGKAIPRLFEKSIFLVPNGLGPNGQGPMGPMGMGPWARVRAGPRPNGQGPMGPMGMGPWARARAGSGPNGQGPMGPMGMGPGPRVWAGPRPPKSIFFFWRPCLPGGGIGGIY